MTEIFRYNLSNWEIEKFIDECEELMLLDSWEDRSYGKTFSTKIEKFEFLSKTLDSVNRLKRQADFIFSFMSLSNNIKTIEVFDVYFEQEHFDDYCIFLEVFKNTLQDEMHTLNKDGKIKLPIKKSKTLPRAQSAEEIEKKQILQLILKVSETHLFDRNDTAIGNAIHHLMKGRFEAEQVRKDLNEKGSTGYKLKIYEAAKTKLNLIISEIEGQIKKLSPET